MPKKAARYCSISLRPKLGFRFGFKRHCSVARQEPRPLTSIEPLSKTMSTGNCFAFVKPAIFSGIRLSFSNDLYLCPQALNLQVEQASFRDCFAFRHPRRRMLAMTSLRGSEATEAISERRKIGP